MMTNPLLKVTLILLSLMSAVFFGQMVLNSAQNSPVSTQGLSANATTSQDTGFDLPATQSRLNFEQTSTRNATSDTTTGQDTVPGTSRQNSTPSRDTRRSFSFHYLDILEWMFAGRGEKAKQRQSQRPSATLSSW